MFLLKKKSSCSDQRVRELETDIRKRVDELRLKLKDSGTPEEEKAKIRIVLERLSERTAEEHRSFGKEKK